MRWRAGAETWARRAGALLGAAALAALVGYLVSAIRAGHFSAAPLDSGALAAAGLLFAAAYGAQATAWHVVNRSFGGASPWRADAARWGVSLLGKYLPGKVFHVIGRVYLYRGEGRDAAVAAAFAAEFVLGMTAISIAGALGLALSPLQVPPAWRIGLWLAIAAGLGATFSGLPDRAVAWLAVRLLRRPAGDMPAGHARALPLAWSFAGFLLMGAGLQALAAAFAPMPATLYPSFLAAFCLSALAGVFAIVVPAGLGVRDVALAWLLSFVMSAPLAATVALAARCALTLGDLAAVALGHLAARGPRPPPPGR